MLTELQVKNFAIIEDLQLSFQDGLNIISGETGAGKSILLKSLSLLMGEKASHDMIRSGSKMAVIEGFFDLNSRTDVIEKLHEIGIPCEENNLVVKRVIPENGKSKIYLNSSLCTLSDLTAIVSPLVEVTSNHAPLIELTSQHESKSLMSKAYHLQLLDKYSMSMALKKDYQETYKELRECKEKLSILKNDAAEKAKQLDFLIYQRDEIQKLDLKENEEVELESAYSRIRHSNKLKTHLMSLEALLWNEDSGAINKMQKAVSHLQHLEEIDPKHFESIQNNLQQANDALDEVSFQLQSYAQNMDDEDLDIQNIEERLSQLRKLQKKYGPDINGILNQLETLDEEIYAIENHDEVVKQMEVKRDSLEKQCIQMAKRLSKVRANGAELLTNSVNEELNDLNMKGLSFLVHVSKNQELNQNGFDDVEFMCVSGKNTKPRSMAKTASGGELSRILLSIKNTIGSGDSSRTYLFDEVDSGISGETAEKVGKKLQQISKGQQVICITHLPQVACFGDTHFFIEKDPDGKQVKMIARQLSNNERINEIARLVSGEKITKTSLAHAKELLNHAL